MSIVKPITLSELKEKASKVKLKDEIIKTINEKLKYNAENYSLIGTTISFIDLISNEDVGVKEALISKIKEIYTEFTITYDSVRIFFKAKEYEYEQQCRN